MSNRDHPECATLEEATHQAPPGYFAVESDSECVGCAFVSEDGECLKAKRLGAGAHEKYPCDYDPDEDLDADVDCEPTIFFQFKPLSEWKFGNEEEENP